MLSVEVGADRADGGSSHGDGGVSINLSRNFVGSFHGVVKSLPAISFYFPP